MKPWWPSKEAVEQAYRTAVVLAAERLGVATGDFEETEGNLPGELRESLQAARRSQLDALQFDV